MSASGGGKTAVDYLIVGAGAMGMAFLDTLLSLEGGAGLKVVLVDKLNAPGGHWNHAYEWVRLHQPALWYGVPSTRLGPGGPHLASKREILEYYANVLARYVASGRVRFLGGCEYDFEREVVRSLASGARYEFAVRRKLVDATYLEASVPSRCAPSYAVAAGARLVPPNALIEEPWADEEGMKRRYSGYTVVGGGKTGMDAVLYLLDRGVRPDAITWIVPNDAWMWNRDVLQPDSPQPLLRFFFDLATSASEASTGDGGEDLYRRMDGAMGFPRLDANVWPTKWRCATVSRDEIRRLGRVKRVVRMGRVVSIDEDRIALERGEIATSRRVLHIDCTADGLITRPRVPIFGDGRITLQALLMCQQIPSSAIIAFVERSQSSERLKSALLPEWAAVPHPQTPADLWRCMGISRQNEHRLGTLRGFSEWWARCRLNYMSHARDEPMAARALGTLRAGLRAVAHWRALGEGSRRLEVLMRCHSPRFYAETLVDEIRLPLRTLSFYADVRDAFEKKGLAGAVGSMLDRARDGALHRTTPDFRAEVRRILERDATLHLEEALAELGDAAPTGDALLGCPKQSRAIAAVVFLAALLSRWFA